MNKFGKVKFNYVNKKRKYDEIKQKDLKVVKQEEKTKESEVESEVESEIENTNNYLSEEFIIDSDEEFTIENIEDNIEENIEDIDIDMDMRSDDGDYYYEDDYGLGGYEDECYECCDIY